MRRCAVVLGLFVAVLGGCKPIYTLRPAESDPTLKNVLTRLKSDLANLDRRHVTQVGNQTSCGNAQVPMVMIRSGITAKASLDIGNVVGIGGEADVGPIPIIRIGAFGSARYSEASEHINSSEFDVGLPLTTEAPTKLSELGKLVATAEENFLTMPHNTPCLTPRTLTVTSAIQITRESSEEIGINYLVVSGKRTWSKGHAYDGTISVTISYDEKSPPANAQ